MTSSLSIAQGLNNFSEISIQRSLWSQRRQSPEMLCHFHIVNFPYLSGNIPSAPAHGTYISQPIRYSRACHNYENVSSRHSMLAGRLFNQGFSVRKLMRTFYKFMGRYPELASEFNNGLSLMICDSVPIAQLYHFFPQLMKKSWVRGCCAQTRACLLLWILDAITD